MRWVVYIEGLVWEVGGLGLMKRVMVTGRRELVVGLVVRVRGVDWEFGAREGGVGGYGQRRVGTSSA